MRKVKVSDVSGPALDWLVAKCEGFEAVVKHNGAEFRHPNGDRFGGVGEKSFEPSTDWAQGGPIKTRERISTQIKHDGWWVACIYNVNDEPTYMKLDHSELVAAMRCYVASKLGHEVEVTEELA